MKGRVVGILEARAGEHLAQLIARRGGVPLSAPALEEIPDVDQRAIAALLDGWPASPFKLVIFQTGVGTKALFQCTDALGRSGELVRLLATATVVVRGPKPVGELNARGVTIALRAADPFTTAAVLEAIGGIALAGERVLVQRYGAANRELRAALEAAGAIVHEIATYRWALPSDLQPLQALIEALRLGRVDALVFTSAVQIQHLAEVAARQGVEAQLAEWINRCVVASVGPVCTRALAARGIRAGVEASPPKLGPLLAALERALAPTP